MWVNACYWCKERLKKLKIETPHDVIHELTLIRNDSERGISLLADAEQRLVTLELAAERAEALALLDATGTVPDRQAIAKLHSQDAREKAALARVEVNRIKTKLKHLSEAMMAVQTSARMVELEWKSGAHR